MTRTADENIEETSCIGSMLMQLMVLVFMGFFFSIHVILSALWSWVLTVGTDVSWSMEFSHLFQSWGFARITVGIPFIIFFFLFGVNCIVYKRLAVPHDLHECLQDLVLGMDNPKAKVCEVSDTEPLYRMLWRMAKKGKIAMPRLFVCYHSTVVNAFTMNGRGKESGILIFDTLLNGLAAPDVEAVLAHEVGHIISGDCRRDSLVGCAIQTLESFWVRGRILCTKNAHEAIFKKDADQPLPIALISAALLYLLGLGLMAIGWLPMVWAKSLHWFRQYHAEYLADARGAWLTGKPQAMADALIVLHCFSESGGHMTGMGVDYALCGARGDGEKDVHPPAAYRVRRWLPDFDGDFAAAYRDVMRRRGIRC